MDCPERIYHQNEFGWTRKCTCHNAVHLNLEMCRDFSEYIYAAVIRCKQETDDPDMRGHSYSDP